MGEGGRPRRRSRGGLSAFGRGVPLLPKDGGAGRQEGRRNSPVRAPRHIHSLWQNYGQHHTVHEWLNTISRKPVAN